MTDEVRAEIKKIIKEMGLNCEVDNFESADDLNWMRLSMRNGLSMDFIREFKHCVHWDKISRYQQYLSVAFIKEFHNHIYWSQLFRNKNISKKVLDSIRYKVGDRVYFKDGSGGLFAGTVYRRYLSQYVIVDINPRCNVFTRIQHSQIRKKI